MNEQELKKRLRTAQDTIIRLNNTVMAMSACNVSRYPANFQELSLDATAHAEKLACRLRDLVGRYPGRACSHPLYCGQCPLLESN